MKIELKNEISIFELVGKLITRFPNYKINLYKPMSHEYIIIEKSFFVGVRVGIVKGSIHCIKYIPSILFNSILGIFIWPFYSKAMGKLEEEVSNFLSDNL